MQSQASGSPDRRTFACQQRTSPRIPRKNSPEALDPRPPTVYCLLYEDGVRRCRFATAVDAVGSHAVRDRAIPCRRGLRVTRFTGGPNGQVSHHLHPSGTGLGSTVPSAHRGGWDRGRTLAVPEPVDLGPGARSHASG